MDSHWALGAQTPGMDHCPSRIKVLEASIRIVQQHCLPADPARRSVCGHLVQESKAGAHGSL